MKSRSPAHLELFNIHVTYKRYLYVIAVYFYFNFTSWCHGGTPFLTQVTSSISNNNKETKFLTTNFFRQLCPAYPYLFLVSYLFLPFPDSCWARPPLFVQEIQLTRRHAQPRRRTPPPIARVQRQRESKRSKQPRVCLAPMLLVSL